MNFTRVILYVKRASVRRAVVLVALLSGAGSAAGWSNHALGTWPALAVLPEVTQAAPVEVERLETFLALEAVALEKLLEREEEWARRNVPAYPPRPEALAFRPERSAAPAELRRRFVAALRINPESRLSLFMQLPPGEAAQGRSTLAESEVTALTRSETSKSNTFILLREGDRVPVIDVLATASDEPDYGLDVGLWSDSGTPFGQVYGFGKQPFGFNPAIEFSSQGPLHVGFFHESAIIYKAAPFLQRTYAEYRIHLWQSLASHALHTGHPYWGWRFAGWALHYIQDLTQPYHARVLPGVGVAAMLWINTLDIAGLHGAKERAVTYVTNRHLAIENYQLHRVRDAWLRKDFDDPPLRALRDTSKDAANRYTDASPREVITVQSYALADALEATLVASLPSKYTSDPTYVFGETEPGVDLHAVVGRSGAAAQQAMTKALAQLLLDFGTHTRAFVRALLALSR
jgi:hypothetical protein